MRVTNRIKFFYKQNNEPIISSPRYNPMKKQILQLILALLTSFPTVTTFAQAITPGENVDVSTERHAPKPVTIHEQETESQLPPFGSNLFKSSSFIANRENGLNPDYIIQPGDRIAMRIWGATEVNNVATVDAQGNLFIPGVGPIKVEGIKNSQLNKYIKGALEQVFTKNVKVYTNLESATPVLVYVTGFVNKPGAYAGIASDSMLYFLEQAGGIDNERGSYRKIKLLRDATADLYDFLLNGDLPHPQFADGDTIVVERKGDTVSAQGAVRNSYTFELIGNSITGAELMHYVRPQANATYATVFGTRDKEPFSTYLQLQDFSQRTLRDGDQVIFEVDQVHETILVRVEGSHLGQSRFAVPKDTHLKDLLDYIKVDPQLADIDAISLRRQSIKRRQKQALEESLSRLEAAVVGRTAITPEGAQIQTTDAKLISDFVQRARKVKPEGILVVAKSGNISNVLLQPDDVITIPEKTNVIQVSGEVMVPQALVYEPGNKLSDYIDRVGGYTDRADKNKHMILRRNGEVIPVYGSGDDVKIQPGDEIVTLPQVPSKSVDIIRMVTDIMFKVAASAAVFVRLF